MSHALGRLASGTRVEQVGGMKCDVPGEDDLTGSSRVEF